MPIDGRRLASLKRDLNQKGLFRVAFESPIFVACTAILTALALFYVEQRPFFIEPISKVVGSVAEALLAAGTFGILFEYLSKVSLIREVVDRTVGQCESIMVGIGSITDDVSEIDERLEITQSRELIVSSRYSALFLENNRQAIYKRLAKNKLPITFIRMRDASLVPHGRAPDAGPDAFFKNMAQYDAEIINRISVYETDTYLVYNFVKSDDGIWIKLYLNERSMEPPPAFYVIKGSILYHKYVSDIDKMLKNSTKVVL